MVVQYEDIRRFKEREEVEKFQTEDGTIQPNEFFHTPESVEELTTQLNHYNNSERVAAWMGAMLAWNLAASMVNKK